MLALLVQSRRLLFTPGRSRFFSDAGSEANASSLEAAKAAEAKDGVSVDIVSVPFDVLCKVRTPTLPPVPCCPNNPNKPCSWAVTGAQFFTYFSIQFIVQEAARLHLRRASVLPDDEGTSLPFSMSAAARGCFEGWQQGLGLHEANEVPCTRRVFATLHLTTLPHTNKP